mmetsp:Transcript_22558/g.80493  ORF Transcript_22558/g.80493 Transcript_22558/m.80493 type:complete len:215 (+) Transcript_22558:600-1244(+)
MRALPRPDAAPLRTRPAQGPRLGRRNRLGRADAAVARRRRQDAQAGVGLLRLAGQPGPHVRVLSIRGARPHAHLRGRGRRVPRRRGGRGRSRDEPAGPAGRGAARGSAGGGRRCREGQRRRRLRCFPVPLPRHGRGAAGLLSLYGQLEAVDALRPVQRAIRAVVRHARGPRHRCAQADHRRHVASSVFCEVCKIDLPGCTVEQPAFECAKVAAA